MTVFQNLMPGAAARRTANTRRRKRRGKAQPRVEISYELLEPRTLLTPTVSISSTTIVLSTPGPTSISGNLNPGEELAAYRIDGTAGEQLTFHSVSTSSTSGSWYLLGENDQEVAGASLGTDFTASLAATSPYYLELVGNISSAISYSFQITDTTTYPPITSSGFDTAQNGTLAGSGSTSFTFQAPAGLPVFFNNLGFGTSITATFTDPNAKTVFSYTPGASNNAGPYILTTSGAYTLKLSNPSSSSQAYDFNMLSLPTAATPVALGPTLPVSGTLNPGNSTAVYSFLGAAGQRMFFDNQTVSGTAVNFTLYKPDGSQVFSEPAFDDAIATLTESGTYYLLVEGTSTTSTNFGFRLTDTAYVPLTFGTTTSETVTNAAQSDVFTFTGTAGERTYFEELSDSNGYYGADWILFGPNSQQITSGAIGTALAPTLPSTGTYTLDIYNSATYSSGTYSFEAFENVDPSTSMTLGKTESGTIVNPGDEATYTFTGSPDQRVYFNSLGLPSDVYAILTDPFGNTVANYISSNAGPYTLAWQGTYSLTVYSYSTTGGTGNYAFSLDDISTATPITLTSGTGTPVTSTLATGLSTNLYQFSGTAGQSLYFEGIKDSPSSGALATLYNRSNGEVTSFYTENDRQATLPTTGTYLLAVAGTSATNSSVSYSFEVFANVDPTVTGTTLPVAGSGTITNPGDQATYTFTGSPGQRIYFNSLGLPSDVYAELNDPYGNEVFDYISGDAGPYTLAWQGTYSLTIFSYSTTRGTGKYTFTLDDISTATPITLTSGMGTPVTSTLTAGLSANLYQFSGTAGQSLYFEGIKDSPADGAEATLYNRSNGEVTSFDTENDRQATLPTTGTYLLAVAGTSASNTSVSYSFSVFANVDPTVTGTTLPVAGSGTITNPGDEATYTFTGSPGQRVYFNSLGLPSDVFAQLTDPYGNQVFYNASSNAGPYTLAYQGTYSLTVYSYYTTRGTGNYAFSLDDISAATPITLTSGKGTPVPGTLATGLSANLYQFSGTAGQSLYFEGMTDSPAEGALVTLYNRSNGTVTSFHTENDDQVTLPTTGNYLLAVAGTNATNTSVSYSFEVFDNVNPTVTGTTLPLTESGTITNPGDAASYTFTGSPGQRVFFNGMGTAISGLNAMLTDPYGNTIFNSNAASDEGPYTLTWPGTYTLTVYSSGTSRTAGAYQFQMLDVSAQSLTPTSTPATVAGTLKPGTQTNIFQIMGTAGQTITLQSNSFSSTSGTWYVVDPNNRTVASARFGTSFTAALALSGPYELIVEGSDTTDASVTYSFAISATTPAVLTPAGFGTAQTGMLAAGASASFSFTGTAGLPVYFNSLVRTSQPITATFTDPSNNTVFSYSPSSNAGPYVLTASGTYTLKLTNTSSSASGTYDFNMLDLPAAATTLELGSPVSATLSPGSTTVAYSFTATPGQRFFLDNQTTSGNSVNLLLIDPYNNQVTSISSSSDYGPFNITNGGTYYVLVDGESTSAVSYGFRLTDTSTVPITFATTINGTVTTATQSDVYSFTGTAGERVYFRDLTDSNGLTGAYWYLYGPTNQYVTESYIGEDLAATLPSNGTYSLVVDNSASYSTGTYSFEVFQNVNPIVTGTTLPVTASGTIVNPGDEASYTFTGSAGQRIFVNGLAASISGLDAILTDPYGSTIFNSTASSNEGPYTLTVPGTYTLMVYSSGTSRATGSYDLVVEDAATATPITLTAGSGTPVNGTLATGVTTNLYSISGTAGERIYIKDLSDSPSYAAYATLYNPANSDVTSDYVDYDNTYTFPSTGTYLLAVAGENASNKSVSYGFEVYENVNPTVTGTTLPLTASGTIANPGDEATYTFTGSAGQRIYVDGLAASISGLDAMLTDPYGNTILNSSTSSDDGPYTLSLSGTYTLTVYSSGTSRATGSYSLVVKDAATATGITLTSGQSTPVNGTLTTGLTTDLYQFSGSAGERLYFESLGDTPSYAAEVELYNPANGNSLSSYVDYDSTVTLPDTGTYLLAVPGVSASNTSVTYSFEIFDNVDPIVTGTTLPVAGSGTIANPGDEATYTFTGSAGQRIYYNGLAKSISNLDATLTDPYGNTIFSGNAATDEGPFTLTVPGTYTLTVYSSGTSRATGSYSFLVEDAATATPITLTAGSGTPVNATLMTGLTANLYEFSGTANERVYFEGLSDSPSDAVYVTLYNPANASSLGTYAESDSSATLPYSGTYLLSVAGQSASNNSPSYDFELFDNVDPSSPLSLNSDVTGSLTNPGDEATYTFTGAIGQQIQFNGLESGSSQIATLYDPANNTVFSSYLGNNAGPYTLTTPGTYTLVLTTNGLHAGNFEFNLLDLQSQTKLQVNTTEADLTVSLSAASTQEVLVQYSTADGTATVAGGDYKPITGLVLFQPGQTTATIEVQAIDRFTTATTNFDVNLSNPVGATIASGGGTGVVTIIGNGQGTINGEVYNDLNGNGSLDGGEPGLAGWTVELLNSANSVVDTTTTASSGDFTFTGIAPGSYTLEEVLQSGYVQTAPAAPGPSP